MRARIVMMVGTALALMALDAGSAAAAYPCCDSFHMPGQMAISPDGRFMYVADGYNTLVLSRDRETGALTPIDAVGNVGGPRADLSRDGRNLYVGAGASVSEFSRNPSTGRIALTRAQNPASRGDVAVSPDDRELYMADPRWNAVTIVDRDGQTGALRFRARVGNGDGVSLASPGGIAITRDGGFLYVAQVGHGPAVFKRSQNGDLTYVGEGPSDCGGPTLRLSPDEKALYAGARTMARDPDTGTLSGCITPSTTYESVDDMEGDGSFDLTPDGAAAFGVDWWQDSLVAYRRTGAGLETAHVYRDGEDGMLGLRKPDSVAVSPDGRYVYVGGGAAAWYGGGDGGGKIAVLRRNPATNDLTFASEFPGIRFDGRPIGSPPVSISINGGAQYTNDRDVELTIDLPRSSAPVQISNDAGFADAESIQWFRWWTKPIAWTLASTGPDRLPKTVYARQQEADSTWTVYSDEIVLDETAPVVASARRVSRSRLRVRARDRVSGVKALQIARHRHNPGHWRRWNKHATYMARGRGLRVRVRDRAGNASRWRKVRGR